MFEMSGVKTRRYRPSTRQIVLDFNSLSSTAATTTTSDNSCDDDIKDEPLTTTSTDIGNDTATQQEQHRDRIKALLLKEASYDIDNDNKNNKKRSSYLSWDDYFLAMSFLSAKRSKDPSTQVGACIVNTDRRIVGIGYNGFPRGCDDDALPWGRDSPSALHTKYPYVVHAEVNAILNKGSANVDGATLYVALFPCNDCAKTIIQAGIREIVYLEDKYHNTDACRASRIMFEMAGVRLRHHTPRDKRIVLDLSCE